MSYLFKWLENLSKKNVPFRFRNTKYFPLPDRNKSF